MHTNTIPVQTSHLAYTGTETIQTSTGLQWKRHIIDYSTRAGGGMQIPVIDIDEKRDP